MAASPCINSVFQWIYDISDLENAVLIVYNVFLIPFSIAANVLVIYTIIRTRQLRHGVNNMFVCLSISDCLIAVLCETANMVLITVHRKNRNCSLELWIQYSSTFLCVFSGMIILSIAIDRFIQTQKTIKMKFDINRKRSVFLMIFSLFVASSTLCLDILGTFMTDYYTWINMAIQLAELLAIISICSLYIMTYYTVSRNRKRQNKILSLHGMYKHSTPNVRYIRAMIVTTIMILASMLICYFPLLILGIHTVFQSTEQTVTARGFWNYLSFHLGFTSSFLSAAIYLYRNKQCRKYMSTFICNQVSTNRKTKVSKMFVLRRSQGKEISDRNVGVTEKTKEKEIN